MTYKKFLEFVPRKTQTLNSDTVRGFFMSYKFVVLVSLSVKKTPGYKFKGQIDL